MVEGGSDRAANQHGRANAQQSILGPQYLVSAQLFRRERHCQAIKVRFGSQEQGALAKPAGETLVMRAVERIEQVVQPTGQQRSTFDDLQRATQNAADQLRSSCPSVVPSSPLARIDTVATRLRAMMGAIKSIRPALENFYASLTDEQKARFNMMRPPPQRG